MRNASIGSISHGTMRTEDLLTTFADELEELSEPDDETGDLIRRARNIEDYSTDKAAGVMEELFDALEEKAPPYCYFGAHEGDGSDYGFWPSMSGIEELAHYTDLSEVPDDMEDDYVVVNDHGNLTLYGADGKEIWAIV